MSVSPASRLLVSLARVYRRIERPVQTVIPIMVTAVSACISGPATAVGGSTIDITWKGPAEPRIDKKYKFLPLLIDEPLKWE